MERLSASFSPPAQSLAPGAAGGTLARFADLADALEHAARAIGRLDALLTRHPLEPAWAEADTGVVNQRTAASDCSWGDQGCGKGGAERMAQIRPTLIMGGIG